MKTADDVLTTAPAAAFAKFKGAMGKLVALPKSATPAKWKPVKRKRKPDA